MPSSSTTFILFLAKEVSGMQTSRVSHRSGALAAAGGTRVEGLLEAQSELAEQARFPGGLGGIQPHPIDARAETIGQGRRELSARLHGHSAPDVFAGRADHRKPVSAG